MINNDIIDFNLQLNQQSLPEGAEIKIPGVGSTPIAVSTQLPAAVAQLSQKGKFVCCFRLMWLKTFFLYIFDYDLKLTQTHSKFRAGIWS